MATARPPVFFDWLLKHLIFIFVAHQQIACEDCQRKTITCKNLEFSFQVICEILDHMCYKIMSWHQYSYSMFSSCFVRLMGCLSTIFVMYIALELLLISCYWFTWNISLDSSFQRNYPLIIWKFKREHYILQTWFKTQWLFWFMFFATQN